MKILVATTEQQGARDSDFCNAEEGEPVFSPLYTCDNGEVDDRCGCRRTMHGARTNSLTTTIKVVETEMSEEVYADVYRRNLINTGWVLILRDKLEAHVAFETKELRRIADCYRVGTVLECREDEFRERV